MRIKIVLLSVAAALLCVGVATAGNGPAKFRFTFQGQLTATPANGGVSITVQGGNKPALRAMLGQPVTQTFAYGSSTEFLKWSKGIPAIVEASDLAAGDYAVKLVFYECGGGSEVEFCAAPGIFGGFDPSFRLVGDTAGGGLAVLPQDLHLQDLDAAIRWVKA